MGLMHTYLNSGICGKVIVECIVRLRKHFRKNPQKSHLRLVLLGIFIRGLDDGIEGELLKLSDEYKLGDRGRKLLFGAEEWISK